MITEEKIVEQITDYFKNSIPSLFNSMPVKQIAFSIDEDFFFKFGDEIQDFNTLKLMVEGLQKFDLLALLLDGKIRFNKVSTIQKNSLVYSVYTYSYFSNSSTLRVIFVMEENKIPNEDEFLNISKYLIQYYSNIPKYRKSRIEEIYPEFSYSIMKQIETCFTGREEKGVLSHFYVQDLKFYFKHMGEQYSLDVHSQIKKEIKKLLKQNDLFFRLNQHSYITYSHNCTIETVSSRYKHVLFELNTLVIQFDLKFHVVDFKNYKKQAFWDQVLSHEKQFLG